MKKMFFALTAFAMMFAACQKEENSPTVSFENAFPVTSDGTATLTLNVTGYTGTEPVTIPVTFTTEAVEGEDYEVSAKEFVYGGASPVTTITVTALKYGTGKSITASLEIPTGFKAGKYIVNTFSLSDKLGYLSFDSKASLLTQTLAVQVTVYDEQGNRKTLEKGDKIAVSVDTENSTAVEGTHFSFEGDKAVTIDAGKGTGNVKIKLVGDEAVQDHDKIVLKMDLGEKYSAGDNLSTTITILGSAFSKMAGKWVINELISDKDWMATENWLADWGYDLEEQLGKYPEFNSEDALEINTVNGTFIPSFKSGFKNYFLGESLISKDKEIIIMKGMEGNTTMQMFLINNVNRYFSDSQTSEDKTALIAMSLITDENTQNELLDLYIIDYEPKDFMTMFYEYTSIDPTIRPTCATGGPDKQTGLNRVTTGTYINLTFKKAE